MHGHSNIKDYVTENFQWPSGLQRSVSTNCSTAYTRMLGTHRKYNRQRNWNQSNTYDTRGFYSSVTIVIVIKSRMVCRVVKSINGHNFVADDSVLLVRDAASLGNQFPTSNDFIFNNLLVRTLDLWRWKQSVPSETLGTDYLLMRVTSHKKGFVSHTAAKTSRLPALQLTKPRDDLKDLNVDGNLILKYNFGKLFLKC